MTQGDVQKIIMCMYKYKLSQSEGEVLLRNRTRLGNMLKLI